MGIDLEVTHATGHSLMMDLTSPSLHRYPDLPCHELLAPLLPQKPLLLPSLQLQKGLPLASLRLSLHPWP